MYRWTILIWPDETKDSRGARRLRTADRDADPGIFALVMATCIVSRAMQLDGAAALSGILLAAGIAAYLVLAAVYAGRFAVNQAGVRASPRCRHPGRTAWSRSRWPAGRWA
jgi:voltage-gated anion channel